MREKVKDMFWKVRFSALNRIKKFAEEEKGASDIVAIIVVIAIILVVAAIFQDSLKTAVTTVFENLTDFIG